SDDAAEELLLHLRTLPYRNSNLVRVTLDGNDPARTAKQLALLLDLFAKDAENYANTKVEYNKSNLNDSLIGLRKELDDVDRGSAEKLRGETYLGAGEKNIIRAQYETVGQMRLHNLMRLDEAEKQAWAPNLSPKVENTPDAPARRSQVQELQAV